MPRPSSHQPDLSEPRSERWKRTTYDDRDHDYIRSYDRRSNERHHRGEGGDYDQTLDQVPLDPIARSGDLSAQ